MVSMITGLLVRYFSAELAKRIILKLVGIYVKRTDNKLDDEVLKAIEEALNEKD